MTTKQGLVAHLAELHSKVKLPAKATLQELQRIHSEQHFRYQTNHYHLPDGKGALAGPGTTSRRPSGWLTGEHAVVRSDLKHAL